jgi:hypothetical protein
MLKNSKITVCYIDIKYEPGGGGGGALAIPTGCLG